MNNISKILGRLLGIAFSVLLLASCNKGINDIGGIPPVSPNETSPLKALGDTLKTSKGGNDSLYYYMVVRAGALANLNNKNLRFTMFVPTNAAMRTFVTAASGGAVVPGSPDAVFKGFITGILPVASAAGIVNFNTISQELPSTAIPTTFPNLPYPTLINPAPTVSPFIRLLTFPSNRNGFYLNNYPLVSLDNFAANGLFHEVAAVSVPPQQFLWDRINTDVGLTYLKAAILRADSGVAVTASGSLQGALLNIGANLTVYAPTDSAFKATLTGAIFQGLVAMGVPAATAILQATALASSPTVFTNPAVAGVLTPTLIKGIVVYQILGVRAFNNNLPTTQTFYPTLLNGAVPTHPGVGLKATFAGTFVIAATAKGVANATASNILINPTPAPNGTSDQFYLNGVLHKTDQVLLPQ